MLSSLSAGLSAVPWSVVALDLGKVLVAVIGVFI